MSIGTEPFNLEIAESIPIFLAEKQVAKILSDVNCGGYVSLEFEGKDPASSGVPKSITMLRDAFGVR